MAHSGFPATGCHRHSSAREDCRPRWTARAGHHPHRSARVGRQARLSGRVLLRSCAIGFATVRFGVRRDRLESPLVRAPAMHPRSRVAVVPASPSKGRPSSSTQAPIRRTRSISHLSRAARRSSPHSRPFRPRLRRPPRWPLPSSPPSCRRRRRSRQLRPRYRLLRLRLRRRRLAGSAGRQPRRQWPAAGRAPVGRARAERSRRETRCSPRSREDERASAAIAAISRRRQISAREPSHTPSHDRPSRF